MVLVREAQPERMGPEVEERPSLCITRDTLQVGSSDGAPTSSCASYACLQARCVHAGRRCECSPPTWPFCPLPAHSPQLYVEALLGTQLIKNIRSPAPSAGHLFRMMKIYCPAHLFGVIHFLEEIIHCSENTCTYSLLRKLRLWPRLSSLEPSTTKRPSTFSVWLLRFSVLLGNSSGLSSSRSSYTLQTLTTGDSFLADTQTFNPLSAPIFSSGETSPRILLLSCQYPTLLLDLKRLLLESPACNQEHRSRTHLKYADFLGAPVPVLCCECPGKVLPRPTEKRCGDCRNSPRVAMMGLKKKNWKNLLMGHSHRGFENVNFCGDTPPRTVGGWGKGVSYVQIKVSSNGHMGRSECHGPVLVFETPFCSFLSGNRTHCSSLETCS